MTCRHVAGDPRCSKTRIAPPVKSPNVSNYDIQAHREIGDYLIMKVEYPSCKDCSFEGVKIMVFNAKVADALHWREIDPHFRNTKSVKYQAPSPIARFPNTERGWKHAVAFVQSLAPRTR